MIYSINREYYSVVKRYKFYVSVPKTILRYRMFSFDVTAAMLVYLNKRMAAMMVCQTNPLEIELYFYANTFYCFSNPIWQLVT